VKDAKFTELEPTVLNEEELKAFFEACTPFQFCVFQCYLRSVLRKAELESLEWTDVYDKLFVELHSVMVWA
jgi:hypothetical protein